MGAEQKLPEKELHFCPYCDGEMAEASWPYCGACEVSVFYCPNCRKPVPRDKRVCPHCAVEIKG